MYAHTDPYAKVSCYIQQEIYTTLIPCSLKAKLNIVRVTDRECARFFLLLFLVGIWFLLPLRLYIY